MNSHDLSLTDRNFYDNIDKFAKARLKIKKAVRKSSIDGAPKDLNKHSSIEVIDVEDVLTQNLVN